LFRLPEVSVRPETVRSIYAMGAGVVALLFLLAPIQAAGPVGTTLYYLLEGLFGVGYYLVPIALIALAVGLMRAIAGSVGVLRILGTLLLFLAGTGLLSLFGNLGGSVGHIILRPISALFGIILGGVMLGACAVAGLLLTLDAPLPLSTLGAFFRKRTIKPEIPIKISGVAEKEVEESVEEVEPEEVKQNFFSSSRKERNEVPAISFAPTDTAYNPPPVSLLEHDKGKPAVGDIKANANIIKRTLMNFGIDVEMDEVSIGPTVTRYALKPAEGVRLQKILGLQNNLELALAASPVRIEAPIPGKSLVGIEVPNLKKSTVGLATLLGEPAFVDDPRSLVFALGRDISGLAHFANIGKMPHLLIAGATGSGKSVAIHALITSLLYRNGPASLRFIMVDPKRVELTMYNPIPHLLTPVITDPKKTILALKWAAKEMERRYQILESYSVRDIGSYHENVVGKIPSSKLQAPSSETPDAMPYIVIVIDELADIMSTYPRELEAAVVRLAQMSRAVGIHLVLSTQRPSVNVITGLIKANIPARMALQVASQIDSRTILDGAGAEKLLGAGDMLYLSGDMSKPHRIQTAFISEDEVKKVVDYVKRHNEVSLDEITLSGNASETQNAIFSASLEDDDVDDDLFEEARSTVEHAGKASTSFLQRKLRIGYARAARLMDILEEKGIIGPQDGARPRDILAQNGTSPSMNSGQASEYAENKE
jgi:S-DNA-T family DNA segregation ATPase FtsK/SpoIIIE